MLQCSMYNPVQWSTVQHYRTYRGSVDEPVSLLLTLEDNAVSLPPLFGRSEHKITV